MSMDNTETTWWSRAAKRTMTPFNTFAMALIVFTVACDNHSPTEIAAADRISEWAEATPELKADTLAAILQSSDRAKLIQDAIRGGADPDNIGALLTATRADPSATSDLFNGITQSLADERLRQRFGASAVFKEAITGTFDLHLAAIINAGLAPNRQLLAHDFTPNLHNVFITVVFGSKENLATNRFIAVLERRSDDLRHYANTGVVPEAIKLLATNQPPLLPQSVGWILGQILGAFEAAALNGVTGDAGVQLARQLFDRYGDTLRADNELNLLVPYQNGYVYTILSLTDC